jgi:hypothetical protein
VSLYRFYIIEKEGHIITQPPTIVELPNDAAALKQAKTIIDDRAIEIWRYTHKIGRLNPGRLRTGVSGTKNSNSGKHCIPTTVGVIVPDPKTSSDF